MGRLIDADKFLERVKRDREHEIYLHSWTADMVLERLDSWYAPTVEAIPKDHIAKAIDKVEEYICDVETDTVKAQGMAQALDIFEQALGEVEMGMTDKEFIDKLTKNIPTWKLVLIDKWTDFKVWFWFKTHKGVDNEDDD